MGASTLNVSDVSYMFGKLLGNKIDSKGAQKSIASVVFTYLERKPGNKANRLGALTFTISVVLHMISEGPEKQTIPSSVGRTRRLSCEIQFMGHPSG